MTKDEIEQSVAHLKELDANADGALDRDEIGWPPAFPRGGFGPPGGPAGFGPPGGSGPPGDVAPPAGLPPDGVRPPE